MDRGVKSAGAVRDQGSSDQSGSIVELALVILTGLGHVAIEVASDGMRGAAESVGRPQHTYNLAAVLLWGGYLVMRVARRPAFCREIGFRKAGFVASIVAGCLFAAAAAVPLAGYGWWMNHFPVPPGFWLLLAIYPVWGLAQQFALQTFVTRNLRPVIPGLGARVAAASLLFALAHFPNWHLMVLTLLGGVGFTWIFEKHRNLWAIGIVHGILGTFAYYMVLGKDPGAELVGLLGRLGG